MALCGVTMIDIDKLVSKMRGDDVKPVPIDDEIWETYVRLRNLLVKYREQGNECNSLIIDVEKSLAMFSASFIDKIDW